MKPLPRGRRPKPLDRVPNRLREWRERRRMSLAELGARVEMDPQRIQRYETGERNLAPKLLPLFATALDCAPSDLLAGEATYTLPVRFAVHAFEFHDGSPADLPAPLERIQAPRRLVVPATECWAAVVEDDSADRRFPAGSTLIVHDIEHARLQLGRAVLVKRHVSGQAGPVEVLVGILQRGVTGDLEVILPTSNRRLPGLVPIRRTESTLGDRIAPYIPAPDVVDYAAQPGDEAVILGVVVRSDRPE